MRCKFCAYDIPAEDIDLGQRLAKCRGCNEVFALDIPRPLTTSQPAELPPATLPARPEKLKVVDENGQGYMQWRWFHPMAFGLLFFCIAWDSFLVFWYWAALFGGAGGKGGGGPFNWLMVIFPIAHVAVGVGITYYTLCLFLNKTQVVYDGAFLTVRSGPVPTRGNRSIARDDIRGFEGDMRIQASTKSTQVTYQLFVIGADNVRKPFISNATDLALVRYVQRQLEAWLKLPAGHCPS